MTERVVLLAGGYGGAKLSHGVAMLAEATGSDIELSVIVNTGDDLELHGLLVCPDLDTVMYTLAGLANDATGWGCATDLVDASDARALWAGDVVRPRRRGHRDPSSLEADARRRPADRGRGRADTRPGHPAQLLPMTDDIVRTKLRTDDGWLSFQDYFVKRHHADDVHEVHFHGIEHAQATTEALEAVATPTGS
jgi:LPPG:FO 2-phospho-L-lactate transferase